VTRNWRSRLPTDPGLGCRLVACLVPRNIAAAASAAAPNNTHTARKRESKSFLSSSVISESWVQDSDLVEQHVGVDPGDYDPGLRYSDAGPDPGTY
jgi:hypothetical protein